MSGYRLCTSEAVGDPLIATSRICPFSVMRHRKLRWVAATATMLADGLAERIITPINTLPYSLVSRHDGLHTPQVFDGVTTNVG